MHLVRAFRKRSKKKDATVSIDEPHVSSIETDVLGGALGVCTRKANIGGIPVEIWQEIFVYCTERRDSSRLSALPQYCAFHALFMVKIRPGSKHDRFMVPFKYLSTFQTVQDRIVRINTPVHFDDLNRFQIQKCRNLRHLVAKSEDWELGEDNLKQVLNDFKELKSLTWHSPFYLSMNIRFSPLTKYGLTTLRVMALLEEAFVMDLLRSCPFLESGSFQTVGQGDTQHQEVIPLPRLKSLDFSFALMYTGWLWKIQGSPILDSFCLRQADSVYALTDRLSLPFRLLSLEVDGDVSPYFILPWLEEESGSLRNLTLSGVPIWKLQVYLDSLKRRGDAMTCPQLETLWILSKRRGRKRVEGDLLRIYLSRHRAGLKSLCIVWDDKSLQLVEIDGTTQHNALTESSNTHHGKPSAASRVEGRSIRLFDFTSAFMHLIRRFRKKSKKKDDKVLSIEEPHVNSIQTDVLVPFPGEHTRKVNVGGVPVEIWQEIFIYCTKPGDSPFSTSSSPSLQTWRSMNIVLSHVCRLFRNIALSMPSLWTTLDLSLSIDQFNTFAERSLQLPIIITSTKHDKFRLPPSHATAFQSLQSRIVKIETPIFYHELDNKFQINKCSNLQHLVSEGLDYETGRDDLQQILHDFKELKSLTWDCPYSLYMTFRHFPPATYGITELRVTGMLEENFVVELLHSSPLLERGSLRTQGWDEDNGQMVSLPRLKSLELSFEFRYHGWLWRIQELPILDKLCFRRLDSSYTRNNRLTLPFQLRSLEICEDIGSHFVLPWLKEEPGTLKSLILSGIPTHRLMDYLDVLKWTGEAVVCPQLEELRLQGKRRVRKKRQGALLEIYSSRRRAGLEPLRIVWGDKRLHPIETSDTAPNSAPTNSESTNHSRARHVRWISVRRR
ncbi:hypothetical protein CPB86DRAFT_828273 [Serendipita vermifera]|nr:hypothetical protein CPB86DRAFT_828273 [Serendipita vermifera]